MSSGPFVRTAEQQELASTVRSLLARGSSSENVRRVMAGSNPIDLQLWSQLAEQVGVVALLVPEEYGGAGFGFAECAVVAEELGRSVACVPYLSAVTAVSLLVATATPEA